MRACRLVSVCVYYRTTITTTTTTKTTITILVYLVCEKQNKNKENSNKIHYNTYKCSIKAHIRVNINILTSVYEAKFNVSLKIVVRFLAFHNFRQFSDN